MTVAETEGGELLLAWLCVMEPMYRHIQDQLIEG